MNRPAFRVARLLGWILILHVWNGYKQYPLQWLVNLVNILRTICPFFFLETANAVDNAIAGEVEAVYDMIEAGKVSLPNSWLWHLSRLHPYPREEAV